MYQSDIIYGKGGKNKGMRRITCVVCGTRRYIDPSKFEEDAKHVCGYCQRRVPGPPYEARIVFRTVQFADDWRPEWYSYKFVALGTIDDFIVESVGWGNMKPVDRARYLANLAKSAVAQDEDK